MRCRLATAACLATLALAPAGADASVAFIDEGVPTALGQPGEANDMTVAAGHDGVLFTDAAGIVPGDEFCRALSPTEVTCAGEGGGVLRGGDGDDRLRDAGAAGGFGARGGPGNDEIVAGAVPAEIFGDDKTVRDDDGNDRIVGSSAAAPGIVNGRDFDDFLNGGGGDDVVEGGAGVDFLSGQTGDDTVDGGDGDDTLEGSTLLDEQERDVPGDAGDDVLRGGAGDDVIRAEAGRDIADGGDGNDWLRGLDDDVARDDNAVDKLVCGSGTDRVSPGVNDRVAVGCETLLVRMYCNPTFPCKAKGTITGKAKGAKKTTTVARASEDVTGSDSQVAFGLKKATKVLKGSKRVALFMELVARRAGKPAGARFFTFQFVRS